MRVYSGGSWMKLRRIFTCMAAAFVAACLAVGCGSKGTTNTVTVSVVSSIGTNIIVGQATTLTATVTGGTTTNLAVNWQPCQFTTTTVRELPLRLPLPLLVQPMAPRHPLQPANHRHRNLYRPGKIPDQTKFPGLQIVITAQSQQDTNRPEYKAHAELRHRPYSDAQHRHGCHQRTSGLQRCSC